MNLDLFGSVETSIASILVMESSLFYFLNNISELTVNKKCYHLLSNAKDN